MLQHLVILAQESNPDVTGFINVFSYLANALLLLFLVINKLSNRSERREISGTVKEEPDYITKKEDDKRHAERQANLARLEKKIDECARTISERIEHVAEKAARDHKEDTAELHDRLTQVSDRVARLEGSGAYCRTPGKAH